MREYQTADEVRVLLLGTRKEKDCPDLVEKLNEAIRESNMETFELQRRQPGSSTRFLVDSNGDVVGRRNNIVDVNKQ